MFARLGLDRLGLSLRLAAIVLLATLSALILGAGLIFMGQERSGPGRASLPGQIAAIVALIEASTPAQRSKLLAVFNTTDLTLAFSNARPKAGPGTHALPAVEWLVSKQFQDAKTRNITAFITDDGAGYPGSGLLARMSPFSKAPLTIAARLSTGHYAVFTTRGSPASRIFGMPPGFWIGGLGVALALFAALAVMREAKPLGQLEASLADFAQDASPRPVSPAGAPDLARLIKATNGMQERISRLLRGRAILMASISHDLRSFLTRLRLRVELLPGEVERTKAIGDIDAMTALLEDALIVARGQVATQDRKPVDILDLATAELSDRLNAIDGTDQQLELKTGDPTNKPNAFTVQGDPLALRRLLSNLLDNAQRHGSDVIVQIDATRHPENGTETASGKPRPARLRLIVDDNGPGIQESDRDAVFEPFHRLDPARSSTTGGSGLGLAIVRQIAQAHGATIGIETSPLGGARFTVSFPG